MTSKNKIKEHVNSIRDSDEENKISEKTTFKNVITYLESNNIPFNVSYRNMYGEYYDTIEFLGTKHYFIKT